VITRMSTARFSPEAWVNDYAIPVDPEGPTEWEVTPAYLTELTARYGPELLCESSYEADELRHDPAAPEWIREWRGPFTVYIVEEED
jgi:hypothetical protein